MISFEQTMNTWNTGVHGDEVVCTGTRDDDGISSGYRSAWQDSTLSTHPSAVGEAAGIASCPQKESDEAERVLISSFYDNATNNVIERHTTIDNESTIAKARSDCRTLDDVLRSPIRSRKTAIKTTTMTTSMKSEVIDVDGGANCGVDDDDDFPDMEYDTNPLPFASKSYSATSFDPHQPYILETGVGGWRSACSSTVDDDHTNAIASGRDVYDHQHRHLGSHRLTIEVHPAAPTMNHHYPPATFHYHSRAYHQYYHHHYHTDSSQNFTRSNAITTTPTTTTHKTSDQDASVSLYNANKLSVPSTMTTSVQHAAPGARVATKTLSSTGEYSSETRRGPSPKELEEAKTPRARNALHTWYKRLEDLYRYKFEHGHCNVPQKYSLNKELGIWVNKQRQEKNVLDKRDPNKKSSLTKQKLKALQEVGFQWARRKGEHSWNEKYIELKQYRELHGHCHVPTKYVRNPALGRWVSTQRSQYKQYLQGEKTSMTTARINKLQKLDFKWTMMKTEE